MGRPAWNVRTMRAEMPARRRQLVAAARRCDWLAGRQTRSDWSPSTDKQSLKGVVWQVHRAQRQQRCCVSCTYYYKCPVVGNFVESCTLSVLRWAFFKLLLVTPFKTALRLLWEVLINFWIYKRTDRPQVFREKQVCCSFGTYSQGYSNRTASVLLCSKSVRIMF